MCSFNFIIKYMVSDTKARDYLPDFVYSSDNQEHVYIYMHVYAHIEELIFFLPINQVE